MDGKLRNMTSIYISKGNRMLLLYRQGGKVVNNVWVGSAGGHFEKTSKFVIEHYLKIGCKTNKIYAGVADGENVVFTEMPAF